MPLVVNRWLCYVAEEKRKSRRAFASDPAGSSPLSSLSFYLSLSLSSERIVCALISAPQIINIRAGRGTGVHFLRGSAADRTRRDATRRCESSRAARARFVASRFELID